MKQQQQQSKNHHNYNFYSLTHMNQCIQNTFTSSMPADPNTDNYTRQVKNSLFSYVQPQSKDWTLSPKILSLSDSCFRQCLGLQPQTKSQVDTKFHANTPSSKILSDQITVNYLSGISPLNKQHSKFEQSYAQCYGGHQFGNWAGQLGDGRAITLSQILNNKSKQKWELQLKGAGKTPYSRHADGRAVLRSSVRQYLCSQAMYALGIPTTRALSLVMTGDKVQRDMFYNGDVKDEQGAIVCRVAQSFIRFGSFELPFARDKIEMLQKLADFVIDHFYSETKSASCSKYLQFFKKVIQRTAELIAKWQCVGFVHGVLNTDNMSILGLTIDYGPYGFLDRFDPVYTPNTTDLPGRRYAYYKQPQIGLWNLHKLAQALSPIIPQGKQVITAELQKYGEIFKKFYSQNMRKKLGLANWKQDSDYDLLNQVLKLMSRDGIDFTNFFRNLNKISSLDQSVGEVVIQSILGGLKLDQINQSKENGDDDDEEVKVNKKEQWIKWFNQYLNRLKSNDGLTDQMRKQLMNKTNPKYILRNYLAQKAIEKAESGDNGLEINKLLEILMKPYDEWPEYEGEYAKDTPKAEYKLGVYLNSCSS